MKKNHLTDIIIVFLLCCAPAASRAEEGGADFTLPEAPPTVERRKLPSLDTPALQKQDFIDETEIEPPFIIHNKDFYSFGELPGRIEAGISEGGFSSRSGNFKYVSPDLWKINFLTYRAAGEFANLCRENNELAYGWQRPLGQRFDADVTLKATDNLFWTQRKVHYLLETGFAWYPAESLNVKVSAGAESSELKDIGQRDDAASGILEVSFVPGANQFISADYKKYSDSAFPAANEYFDSDLVYGLTIRDSLLLKAGARMQNSDIFPEGGIYWNFLPGTRLSVDAKAGTERPSWSELYMRDMFLSATAGLAWPKSKFNVNEELSYYLRDLVSFKLDVSQASWENYICTAQVPGSSYMAPVNAVGADGVYIARAGAEASLKIGPATAKLNGTKNYTPQLPMIPDYSYGGDVEYGLPFAFTAAAGMEYISERRTSLGGADKLDPSQEAHASLKKEFPEGVIVYASCANILGDKIETQPGFISRAPVFTAGLTVKFQ